MNECIIHYDSLSCHNDPVFVTKRTSNQSCQQKKNVKNEMTETFFNVNWYQKKIFRGKGIMEIHAILSLQNVFAKSKLIQSINPFQNFNSVNKKFKSASTRTSTKEVTNGLSPVKRAKRKRFSSSGEKCVMEKILRSFFASFATIICFIIATSLPDTY